MSKHTPGPWFAYTKANTIAVGTGKKGKEVDAIVHWFGFDACHVGADEQAANAKLIAAAPEMLAVLERLLKLNREGRIMARVWGDAETVVAKATDQ